MALCASVVPLALPQRGPGHCKPPWPAHLNGVCGGGGAEVTSLPPRSLHAQLLCPGLLQSLEILLGVRDGPEGLQAGHAPA